MARWLLTSPPRTATTWTAATLTALGHECGHETLVPTWGERFEPEPVWDTSRSHADWAAVPVAAEAAGRGWLVGTWLRPWRDWLPSMLGGVTGPGWVAHHPYRGYARFHAGLPATEEWMCDPVAEALAVWCSWYVQLLSVPGLTVFESPADMVENVAGVVPGGYAPINGGDRAQLLPAPPEWLVRRADAVQDAYTERALLT